jgi:hypothetical protein
MEKDDFKPDIKKFSSLESLSQLLTDADKRAHSTFLNHLISACVESSDIEEKALAFKTKPTAVFARTLGLVKPYSGALVNRGDLNEVKRVPLSELGDDDNVLMSNIVIDQGFYESVGSKPEELLVYEHSENLGLRKNKKFQALPAPVVYKVKDLLDILKSISASNKGMKSASAARLKASDEDDEDLEDVAL